MARLPKVAPIGIPQHVVQRGNNRQVCFCSDEDFTAYAGWLRECAAQYQVQVHGWVFMTNHVHLLLTPLADQAISRMMQALGRLYVRYFNRECRRSGTLWEGRFKSCLVQSEEYLLHCYRYIELNPVRAAMVSNPGEYHWSSYSSNALGVPSSLLTPHPEYLKLGRYPRQRRERYRALFASALDPEFMDKISTLTDKGLALGNDRFKAEIEAQCQRRVTPERVGRPRIEG
ncbi:transposase [Microbulbifer elongatus]|uniref:transposase n=1 Tax=Microbulbifer elongatus TaxID=86173 RepID=UPI001CFDBE8A|nr:transposase [Microbulbifer elongatus]